MTPADELAAAQARIAELESFIAGDRICPCCTQTFACSDDCTFAADSPNDFERMSAARATLASTSGAESAAQARIAELESLLQRARKFAYSVAPQGGLVETIDAALASPGGAEPRYD